MLFFDGAAAARRGSHLPNERRTMNTLKQKEETPERPSGPGDYYEVVSQYGTWFVTPETAARIGRELDRRWRPRWIKFVDIAGGRAWVRTDTIESVVESTELQRTGDRRFHYLRRKEARADRRWDDDED
jgi:hypothetical protein